MQNNKWEIRVDQLQSRTPLSGLITLMLIRKQLDLAISSYRDIDMKQEWLH